MTPTLKPAIYDAISDKPEFDVSTPPPPRRTWSRVRKCMSWSPFRVTFSNKPMGRSEDVASERDPEEAIVKMFVRVYVFL